MMNSMLDDLFINVVLGIGNKTTKIKFLRESLRKTPEN